MSWSEEDYKALQSRREKAKAADVLKKDPLKGVKQWQALGRLPKGQMNKTEQAYANRLDLLKMQGSVLDWKFHAIRVRLANNTWYETDFIVLHADMTLAIHETKGEFTSEKGQMKIKLAAEALPWFRFYKCIKVAEKNGGGWRIEDFSCR